MRGGDEPPEGSRAAAYIRSALAGGGGPESAALREAVNATEQPSASMQSPPSTPSFPFGPRAVVYDNRVTTPRDDPSTHSFADAGLYMSLSADAADTASAFPGGYPGALAEEFACTKAHALLVRPVGVALVHHLEVWRQENGRALANRGAAVLDIDPKTPYAKTELEELSSRAAALGASASAPGEFDATFVGGLSGSSRFRPARLLSGPRGSGKSAVLTYAVHYARKAGWITVLVPDAFAISHLGLVLAPSRARPGSYDQHDAALAILRDVSRTHGAALQRIPQRGRYAAHRYLPKEKDVVVSAQREELRKAEEAEVARLKAMAEAAGKAWDAASFKSVYEDESDLSLDRKGFTLADMVEWGLRHPSALSDTLIDLLSELRQTTEFPVLIAVDGINHFYTQGPYAAEGELLPPERLSVQAAFCPWGASGFRESMQFKRGLWLCAVSHTHSMDMKPMFSAAAVHDRFRVAVPPLTRQEIYSTLKHYAACGTFFMLQGESPERSP